MASQKKKPTETKEYVDHRSRICPGIPGFFIFVNFISFFNVKLNIDHMMEWDDNLIHDQYPLFCRFFKYWTDEYKKWRIGIC